MGNRTSKVASKREVHKINIYDQCQYLSEVINIEGKPTSIKKVGENLLDCYWKNIYVQVEQQTGKIMDISPIKYQLG